MLKIYLTNLGKYAEGYLVGEWVELPITDDELGEVKKRIGINQLYEEWFITDYETDIDGVEVGEYDSLEKLNQIAEALNELHQYDSDILMALLSNGYSLDDALERMSDCFVYSNCSTMEDVARQYCEDCGILDAIPENLQDYFDFKAFGRDMSFESTYIFMSSGNCVEIVKQFKKPIDIRISS